MSNSLDPDQARHFVAPVLGPNCLQLLSADATSRKRVMDLRTYFRREVNYIFKRVNAEHLVIRKPF